MNIINAKKLADSMEALVADTERLLHATSDDLTDAAVTARKHAARSLQVARKSLQRAERRVRKNVRKVARGTDRYVRVHPWNTIGLSMALAFIAGWLAADLRRSDTGFSAGDDHEKRQ